MCDVLHVADERSDFSENRKMQSGGTRSVPEVEAGWY
uniref:Uncharacterized protein n=1 Tax=Peronospora matthiolae TaxID=2874970 RepID=A0AAV1TYL5_9STRA